MVALALSLFVSLCSNRSSNCIYIREVNISLLNMEISEVVGRVCLLRMCKLLLPTTWRRSHPDRDPNRTNMQNKTTKILNM
ncbi:hypothetical protein CIPAW_11G088400 [Carya illinoinensis]|uniref:Secreted protein n=1 Tax=Carya illinoinensis TaxID=32201 RepID=A0A8T1NX30_CARIL|nr:hypothetical protein CIPAW_11G088400 [Carya illinoinensis]